MNVYVVLATPSTNAIVPSVSPASVVNTISPSLMFAPVLSVTCAVKFISSLILVLISSTTIFAIPCSIVSVVVILFILYFALSVSNTRRNVGSSIIEGVITLVRFATLSCTATETDLSANWNETFPSLITSVLLILAMIVISSPTFVPVISSIWIFPVDSRVWKFLVFFLV